jgi:sulfur carrier protein
MVESISQGVALVKLILRNKEYEVKPGMTLLSALQKIDVIPESVIATRDGEMILDDEILKDGEVIKLIAVISGGICHCEGISPKQSPNHMEIALSHTAPVRAGSPPGRDGRRFGAGEERSSQ